MGPWGITMYNVWAVWGKANEKSSKECTFVLFCQLGIADRWYMVNTVLNASLYVAVTTCWFLLKLKHAGYLQVSDLSL